MWIGQEKPTIAGGFKFVQKTQISWSNFLADLKAQSKHCDKNPGSFGYKIFKRNNCGGLCLLGSSENPCKLGVK